MFFEEDGFDEETMLLLGSMCLDETQPMEEYADGKERRGKKGGVDMYKWNEAGAKGRGTGEGGGMFCE